METPKKRGKGLLKLIPMSKIFALNLLIIVQPFKFNILIPVTKMYNTFSPGLVHEDLYCV